MTCSRCSNASTSGTLLDIERIEDLIRLRTWRRRYEAVTVRLSQLTLEESRRLNDAIRVGYHACGCVHGRVATVIAACLGLATLSAGWLMHWRPAWEMVLLCVFALLAIPLVTMLASIYRARRRLWRYIDTLLS